MSPSTLTRWITKGIDTPAGRVRLRAVRIGGKWMLTDDWFADFLASSTAAYLPADAAPSPRSPAQRVKAVDQASAELADLGV